MKGLIYNPELPEPPNHALANLPIGVAIIGAILLEVDSKWRYKVSLSYHRDQMCQDFALVRRGFNEVNLSSRSQ